MRIRLSQVNFGRSWLRCPAQLRLVAVSRSSLAGLLPLADWQFAVPGLSQQYGRKELLSLANYIFKSARLKIRSNFTALKDNLDSETRKLNQFVIDKKLEYLERMP